MWSITTNALFPHETLLSKNTAKQKEKRRIYSLADAPCHQYFTCGQYGYFRHQHKRDRSFVVLAGFRESILGGGSWRRMCAFLGSLSSSKWHALYDLCDGNGRYPL